MPLCNALHKQLALLRWLSGEPRYSVYLVSRFDAAFDSPVKLSVLDTGAALYVARTTWFAQHSEGGENLLADGKGSGAITWREGEYSLANSVSSHSAATPPPAAC